jgi:hypothetical protein
MAKHRWTRPERIRRNRVRAVVVSCAMVLSLFFASTPAQAGLFNTTEALNASDEYAADPMFDSVGFMYYNNGSFWDRGGSGVLIAPDWVITAGHNLLIDGSISQLRFYTGLDLFSGNYQYTAADSWYVYPGYVDNAIPGTNVDLALVHLSTPITDIAPAVLFSGQDQSGTLMYMAGYGVPGTRDSGVQTFDAVKRAGSNFADFDTAFAQDQYWVSSFSTLGSSDVQALEWQSTPGDSGGGWFATIGGTTYLVGINCFEAEYYSYSGALRVSPYDEWISSTTQVPEPGTLLMFASGSLALLPRLLRRRKEKEAA